MWKRLLETHGDELENISIVNELKFYRIDQLFLQEHSIVDIPGFAASFIYDYEAGTKSSIKKASYVAGELKAGYNAEGDHRPCSSTKGSLQ